MRRGVRAFPRMMKTPHNLKKSKLEEVVVAAVPSDPEPAKKTGRTSPVHFKLESQPLVKSAKLQPPFKRSFSETFGFTQPAVFNRVKLALQEVVKPYLTADTVAKSEAAGEPAIKKAKEEVPAVTKQAEGEAPIEKKAKETEVKQHKEEEDPPPVRRQETTFPTDSRVEAKAQTVTETASEPKVAPTEKAPPVRVQLKSKTIFRFGPWASKEKKTEVKADVPPISEVKPSPSFDVAPRKDKPATPDRKLKDLDKRKPVRPKPKEVPSSRPVRKRDKPVKKCASASGTEPTSPTPLQEVRRKKIEETYRPPQPPADPKKDILDRFGEDSLNIKKEEVPKEEDPPKERKKAKVPAKITEPPQRVTTQVETAATQPVKSQAGKVPEAEKQAKATSQKTTTPNLKTDPVKPDPSEDNAGQVVSKTKPVPQIDQDLLRIRLQEARKTASLSKLHTLKTRSQSKVKEAAKAASAVKISETVKPAETPVRAQSAKAEPTSAIKAVNAKQASAITRHKQSVRSITPKLVKKIPVPAVGKKFTPPPLVKKVSTPGLAKKTTPPSLGKTISTPAVAKKTVAPTLGKKTSTTSLGKKTSTPSLGKKLSSPSLGKKTIPPSLGKKLASPALGKKPSATAVGKRIPSPALGKRISSPALGKRISSPALGKRISSPAIGKRTSSPTFGSVKSPPLGRQSASPPLEKTAVQYLKELAQAKRGFVSRAVSRSRSATQKKVEGVKPQQAKKAIKEPIKDRGTKKPVEEESIFPDVETFIKDLQDLLPKPEPKKAFPSIQASSSKPEKPKENPATSDFNIKFPDTKQIAEVINNTISDVKPLFQKMYEDYFRSGKK